MKSISLPFIYCEAFDKLLGSSHRISQPEECFDIEERRRCGTHYTDVYNFLYLYTVFIVARNIAVAFGLTWSAGPLGG